MIVGLANSVCYSPPLALQGHSEIVAVRAVVAAAAADAVATLATPAKEMPRASALAAAFAAAAAASSSISQTICAVDASRARLPRQFSFLKGNNPSSGFQAARCSQE